MPKAFPKEITYRTGVLRSASIANVLAEDTESMDQGAPHSILLTWKDGQWFHLIIDWIANSACVRRMPRQQVVVIGEDGEFLVAGGGVDPIEGEIPVDVGTKRGPLRSVRSVDGIPFAVGMGGVIFRQDQPNLWVRADDGISETQHLESIDGFSTGDMYAVGRMGIIWHFYKGAWHRVISPTNVILTSVCCAGDGNVYACGLGGTLVRGRRNSWVVIEQTESDADLWDVEWFKGKLYISTMTSVYELEGNALKESFGNDKPETAYHLSSVDEVMWSIGSKDIMAFDGKRWKRIE
jgi:hypothetical protein